MKDNNQSTYHKRLLTEIPFEPNKTQKVKSLYSFYSPVNVNRDNDLPHIKKSLTKVPNPSISIVKNFKIISKIVESTQIAKPQVNTQRPIKKLTEIVNDISNSNNLVKKALFSRKSYDEYYKKISHQSNYTSFTKMTSMAKDNVSQRKEGNNSEMNETEKEKPYSYSISKTVTKENTMDANKYPNSIDTVKTPEDLHFFFVHMIQKGKKIEFDIDNDTEANDDNQIG